MVYLVWFIVGLIINDGRVLYKVLGKNITYIKYKVVLYKLGLGPLVTCIALNFSKGFLPVIFIETGEFKLVILTLILLVGNFLGALPGKTDGNEFLIFIGICCGYNYLLVKTSLALFIGVIILFKNLTISIWLFFVSLLISLLFYDKYIMFVILILIMLKYVIYQKQSHFLPIINKIVEKFTLNYLKG